MRKNIPFTMIDWRKFIPESEIPLTDEHDKFGMWIKKINIDNHIQLESRVLSCKNGFYYATYINGEEVGFDSDYYTCEYQTMEQAELRLLEYLDLANLVMNYCKLDKARHKVRTCWDIRAKELENAN